MPRHEQPWWWSLAPKPIPFNRPSLEGDELRLLRQAVEGGHSSARGPFTAAVCDLLVDALGARDVLLTTSCTAALELSALLLDLRPGDVVIVPSFTFVSTALAFARSGATLRFADIEPRTLGIDPESVAGLLDERVRAVVAVHYAGIGCDLDGLGAVLAGSDVALVEDNAHGLFGRHQGRPLGSFGRFATLSFHETKNFTCGEGGALIVNDPADADRAHVCAEKGTNRRQFLAGEVDRYTWVDTGSSFGLSDLLAAYLLGQLRSRDRVLAARRRVAERYAELLAPHEGELGFSVMRWPADRDPAWHMFYVLLADAAQRGPVLDALRAEGVGATFHYVPLHSAPAAGRFVDRSSACPVTDDVSSRLVRLPLFNSLSDDDVVRVAGAVVRAVRASRRTGARV